MWGHRLNQSEKPKIIRSSCNCRRTWMACKTMILTRFVTILFKTKTLSSSLKCSREEVNLRRLKTISIIHIMRWSITFHRLTWPLSLLVNNSTVVEVSLILHFRRTLKTLKFIQGNRHPNIRNLILRIIMAIRRTLNCINSWSQTC